MHGAGFRVHCFMQDFRASGLVFRSASSILTDCLSGRARDKSAGRSMRRSPAGD